MKAYCQWIVLSCTCIRTLVILIICVSTSSVSSQDLLTGYQDVKPSKDLLYKSSQTGLPIKPFAFQNHKTKFKSSSVSEFITYKLDVSVISEIKKISPKQIELSLPLADQNEITIHLEEVELFTDNYKLTNSSGEQTSIHPKFYRGTIADDPSSTATMTIAGSSIRLLLVDNIGTYQISQSKLNPKEYVFFNATKATGAKEPGCLTDDVLHHPFVNTSNITKEINKKSSNTSGCIPLYIETDLATFQHFNNDLASVENYITALVNEVATIYNNEGIQISLSQIHVTTEQSQDFSSNYIFARDVLEAFALTRQNDYQGRLAHFVSHRNLLGGIGWVDVLCSTYSTFQADWDGDGTQETHHYGPYAVSSGIGDGLEDYPSYSWDVNIFAHEMGHNLGSPHTHACFWGPNNLAIDNCQTTEGGCGLMTAPTPDNEHGTIMSYCHLTNVGVDLSKGFGSLPGALVLSKFQNASCQLSCASDVPGCTDNTFHNYDPSATTDDGSCQETCSDLIKNADETGIDCGGALCLPCQDVCTDNFINLMIVFDGFPSETSWTLTDSLTGDTLDFGGQYSDAIAHDTLVSEYCLTDGTYTLEFKDLFGDGICCSQGNGMYLVSDAQNNPIVQGGSFGTSIIHYIRFAGETCQQSLNLANQTLSGDYQAANMIESFNSMVNNNEAVMFNSSEVVILNEFTISIGSTLEIYNSGCN